MASTYLSRTFSSGNRRTFTISVWVKRTATGENNYILDCPTSSNHDNAFRISSSDEFGFGQWEGSDVTQLNTNAKLRDTNAWYHLVASVDTTQSTASDRVKLYINGELQTSFSTSNYPTQNFQYYTNSGNAHYIGYKQPDNARYFNGLMSHFHFIDGTAYDASAFGSTDSTTGEWKINTSPSVTYGTNGFFILKDGNSVTDQSGNGNNWTVGGGTLTKTEDNPSNVFATLNPLASCAGQTAGVSTFTNGNTTAQGTNNSYVNGGSTLMMSSGKFYAEMKYVATSNASRCWVGITEDVSEISRINQDVGSYNVVYRSQTGGLNIEGGGENSYGATFTTGDIIGVALDLDNNRLFFSKNGTWQNSGDPTSSTGAITTFTAPASTINGGWFFASGSDSNAQNNTVSWNFGNGYFGTTAVSSAGTNASGNGIFEYDVPTGYTALSTKGLNE